MINNSGGEILYGMHFYPGVAQYGSSENSHRIYLNEDTLRKMDPTFAGKPIFVEHIDEVDQNLDELKKESDGWVIESFYNSADGKHWVKFIVVSERGKRAVKNGFRLSNAYHPQQNGKSGIWNGVTYDNEVVDGEYEHLAIVKNPRYDESVIMTPGEFKKYNENLKQELIRISNSKEKNMGLKFWSKKPVENSLDLENTCVTLPKSKKEFSLFQIVNRMDEMEEKKKENEASPDMRVKLHDGTMCNVGELVEKYKDIHEKMENMKKKNEEMDTMTGLEPETTPVDVEGDLHNDEEDKEAKKKALELAKHEDKEIAEDKEEKKINKKKNSIRNPENFESLKNAPFNNIQNEIRYDSVEDKLARGKSRYGS